MSVRSCSTNNITLTNPGRKHRARSWNSYFLKMIMPKNPNVLIFPSSRRQIASQILTDMKFNFKRAEFSPAIICSHHKELQPSNILRTRILCREHRMIKTIKWSKFWYPKIKRKLFLKRKYLIFNCSFSLKRETATEH